MGTGLDTKAIYNAFTGVSNRMGFGRFCRTCSGRVFDDRDRFENNRVARDGKSKESLKFANERTGVETASAFVWTESNDLHFDFYLRFYFLGPNGIYFTVRFVRPADETFRVGIYAISYSCPFST